MTKTSNNLNADIYDYVIQKCGVRAKFVGKDVFIYLLSTYWLFHHSGSNYNTI